jgi:hypothetical protein
MDKCPWNANISVLSFNTVMFRYSPVQAICKTCIIAIQLFTIKDVQNKHDEIKKEESFLTPLPTCDPAGARTQDPILKRDVLYLLSY